MAGFYFCANSQIKESFVEIEDSEFVVSEFSQRIWDWLNSYNAPIYIDAYQDESNFFRYSLTNFTDTPEWHVIVEKWQKGE